MTGHGSDPSSPAHADWRLERTTPSKPSSAMPWLVLVGGFLGADKTTLLLAAAKELERRGLRSAMIVNDQSESLVDTHYAALSGIRSEEVTGGCFCCRFSELVRTMEKLRDYAPHAIFAEPVGSCTDVVATVLRPLRDFRKQFRIAPFSVLVDPVRAAALMAEDADENLAFLFRKQLEEADLICFTKSDLDQEIPHLGSRAVRQLSAKTGQGVAAWLDEVLSGDSSAGSQILDIDYARYAQAEAALAWLNAQAVLRPDPPLSPMSILGPLFDCVERDLTRAGVTVVHLKATIESETGYVKAAICSNGEEPKVEGTLDASPALNHQLLVNLRCVGNADQVQEVVEGCILSLEAEVSSLRLRCFHPAAPNPERGRNR